MDRRKRIVVDNLEAIVFFGAVAVIIVLLVWWGIFASRLIVERQQLAEDVARTTISEPVRLAAALAAEAERADRQRVMLLGEGSMFGAMLLVCVGALFLVARQRRKATQRLVRLLQFTTHELKTPIAGVRALLQSLQLGSIPPESQNRLLEQGVLETNRLEHLTETILAFQRATSKTQLQPARVSSAVLISDVLEHRRITFGSDQIEHHGAPGADIVVDRDAFRVVLENLLDNARKYGHGKVEMNESIVQERWRLELVDHGEGFEPEESERIFAPFERDAREGVSTHGSGLGLYISRQLVRGMGGELSARSEGRGRGAVFVVELPIATRESRGTAHV